MIIQFLIQFIVFMIIVYYISIGIAIIAAKDKYTGIFKYKAKELATPFYVWYAELRK